MFLEGTASFLNQNFQGKPGAREVEDIESKLERILEGIYESYRHTVTQELRVQNDAKPKHPMTSFQCSRQMCFLGDAKHRKYTVNERKGFVPVICQLPRTTSSPRRSRVSRTPCSESFVCHPTCLGGNQETERLYNLLRVTQLRTAISGHCPQVQSLSPHCTASVMQDSRVCSSETEPCHPEHPSSNMLVPHCCNSQTQN